jgi:hypothetical protein
MKTFYLAVGNSSRFSFEALGETEALALTALHKTLRKHGKQYQISTNWWKDESNIDIYVQEIKLNQGYRDREEL